MALAYDARRSTRDIDAVFEPKMVVYEAAAQVADELGLSPDWLNDSAKGFLYSADPFEGPVFEFPGLRVQAASPEMLLAMKVVAARIGEDDDDVASPTTSVSPAQTRSSRSWCRWSARRGASEVTRR